MEKLLIKQEYAVYYLKDNETEEVLYGGAAGGGKSALGCLWLIEMCQTYPGSRWLMGRSKLKTLRETTLNTFFELTGRLKLGQQFTYNAQDHIINWHNGSQILLKDLFHYPSDPNYDSLGSLEITGAFIDECNQVVYLAWQIVKSRIRYKLTEFKSLKKMLKLYLALRWLMLSTKRILSKKTLRAKYTCQTTTEFEKVILTCSLLEVYLLTKAMP